MDLLDKHLAELTQRDVPHTKRPDFDAFWTGPCNALRPHRWAWKPGGSRTLSAPWRCTT